MQIHQISWSKYVQMSSAGTMRPIALLACSSGHLELLVVGRGSLAKQDPGLCDIVTAAAVTAGGQEGHHLVGEALS